MKVATFSQLANIGVHAPIGSVAMSTSGSGASFLVGRTGQFVTQSLDESTLYRLRSMGWIGYFGVEIIFTGK